MIVFVYILSLSLFRSFGLLVWGNFSPSHPPPQKLGNKKVNCSKRHQRVLYWQHKPFPHNSEIMYPVELHTAEMYFYKEILRIIKWCNIFFGIPNSVSLSFCHSTLQNYTKYTFELCFQDSEIYCSLKKLNTVIWRRALPSLNASANQRMAVSEYLVENPGRNKERPLKILLLKTHFSRGVFVMNGA